MIMRQMSTKASNGSTIFESNVLVVYVCFKIFSQTTIVNLNQKLVKPSQMSEFFGFLQGVYDGTIENDVALLFV